MAKQLVLLFFIGMGFHSVAQKRCVIENYTKQEISADPLLQNKLEEIEAFTKAKINESNSTQRTTRMPEVIKIPVVFHVLYHTPEQNVSIEAIDLMMAALNRDFNKKNSDTANIPSVFKSLSTSMGFEFKLATSAPSGAGTTGVIRKYTPITYWMSDDKMKFSKNYGDDAWDSKSYLNIWLCNMQDALGYSTLPGMDPQKDGIVISFEDIFNAPGTSPAINDFRTFVHEVGHWLNLNHLWGDGYCGDDKIDDTPKQSTYTPGCPNGIRVSCGNSVTGDMYMNFMDFTNDVCMNMFTVGQRRRARALFEAGGARNSILYSKGLNFPLIPAAQPPDYYPKWLQTQIYPNPATSYIDFYFEYDGRWLGREMKILDMNGKVVMNRNISSKIQRIDISKLSAGIYFIVAEKEEEKLHAKFIKL
jgi:Pregnancy-associated plasma protein-A/Secretion system C-terminal sorting domain